jgi:hypothetical protein
MDKQIISSTLKGDAVAIAVAAIVINALGSFTIGSAIPVLGLG